MTNYLADKTGVVITNHFGLERFAKYFGLSRSCFANITLEAGNS